MEKIIGESWAKKLTGDEIKILKDAFDEIEKKRAKTKEEILPLEGEDSGIYYALKITDFDNVKVLIIGQDPYPNKEDAHGLAFSKKTGKLPASLKNIFQEIDNNTGIVNKYGNLKNWAQQGVLLLNRALTFEKNTNLNERLKFWEKPVSCIINALINRNKPLVVILWGMAANTMEAFSIEKEEELKEKNIYILRSSHPSNMGNAKNKNITIDDKKIDAFIGCGHFSKCNEILENAGIDPINWQTEILN